MNALPFLLAAVLAATAPAQIVHATWAVSGCSPTRDLLVMRPAATGSGVDFVAGPSLQHPLVLVLALNASPTLLSGSGSVPCLLLPRPELMVVLGPSQVFPLPIPAGTPPATVWVQGVEVEPFALLTSHGFRIVVR